MTLFLWSSEMVKQIRAIEHRGLRLITNSQMTNITSMLEQSAFLDSGG
jgi:hypothetical protein